MNSKTKIVITGSNGFLGSNVMDKAYEDFLFIPVSTKEKTYREYCQEAIKLVKEYKPDIFLNIGSSQKTNDTNESAIELINYNVLFVTEILSIIKEHSPTTKFVNIGTSWELDELGQQNPFNLYAATKAAVKPILNHFRSDGLEVTQVRLFDTYGVGDKRNKLVSQIIESYNNNSVLNMSLGEQSIDLVYIDDAVDAILNICNQQVFQDEYEICSGTPVKVKEILTLLDNLTNRRPSEINLGHYQYRKRERFNLFYTHCTPKGWSPKVKLGEGLAKILNE